MNMLAFLWLAAPVVAVYQSFRFARWVAGRVDHHLARPCSPAADLPAQPHSQPPTKGVAE